MRGRRMVGGAAGWILAAVLLSSMLPVVAVAAGDGAASRVNINTAGAEELQDLPGIGPSLAARIIEYRDEHGPFRRIEDLMNVRGIGEKNFLKLRDRITVEGDRSGRG